MGETPLLQASSTPYTQPILVRSTFFDKETKWEIQLKIRYILRKIRENIVSQELQSTFNKSTCQCKKVKCPWKFHISHSGDHATNTIQTDHQQRESCLFTSSAPLTNAHFHNCKVKQLLANTQIYSTSWRKGKLIRLNCSVADPYLRRPTSDITPRGERICSGCATLIQALRLH